VEHILGICLMMDPGQQGSDIALTLPPSSLIPLKALARKTGVSCKVKVIQT